VPTVAYLNLSHPNVPDLTFNAKVIYPVLFNESLKHFYPLLVQTYNGPNSQRVTKSFGFDVHAFAASRWHHGTQSPYIDDILLDEQQHHGRQGSAQDEVKYRRKTAQPPFVVLHLDVRGTGFRGEAFRSPIVKQLGITEATDIIETVRKWVAENDFVDPEKVGFWGWSYGGFLSR
jgi:dipeptidyl aminopeptidase/acylaminoacyl peptidase